MPSRMVTRFSRYTPGARVITVPGVARSRAAWMVRSGAFGDPSATSFPVGLTWSFALSAVPASKPVWRPVPLRGIRGRAARPWSRVRPAPREREAAPYPAPRTATSTTLGGTWDFLSRPAALAVRPGVGLLLVVVGSARKATSGPRRSRGPHPSATDLGHDPRCSSDPSGRRPGTRGWSQERVHHDGHDHGRPFRPRRSLDPVSGTGVGAPHRTRRRAPPQLRESARR